jgi:hypothetical protein
MAVSLFLLCVNKRSISIGGKRQTQKTGELIIHFIGDKTVGVNAYAYRQRERWRERE